MSCGNEVDLVACLEFCEYVEEKIGHKQGSPLTPQSTRP